MQTRLDFHDPAAAPAAGDAADATFADGHFHPAVAAWFRERFGAPTATQRAAWRSAALRQHTLVAAPTGSGKTLAAFMGAIDSLVREGLQQPLPDAVRILYVSPLKALSNDVQKNLQQPLAGIRAKLRELGCPDVPIRDAVRTGDTPQTERERMRRRAPHILVTTPESLFILLTSDSGRAMLRGTQTVIVDELHAVAGSKRGAHLMLSLERLAALCQTPPVRIGLSATVKPIDDMARYLVGNSDENVEIVDAGHVRQRDIAMELPPSPLAAVMSNEIWGEVYDRLAELAREHRTTLVFVNQRRTAERAARFLAERLGETEVTAHHGSLSREHRLQAEQRLKAGELRVLVATSSLELGIDIGDVDLVCQLGSPKAISAFLQRVGRAGHAIDGTPKGRLFPLSLDDLLECTALMAAVGRGDLDRILSPEQPLDALAQQIVAEAGAQEWQVDALYACFRKAWPYRDLTLKDFEALVGMLADGYSTRRGRRGAHLHHDAVNRVIRGRRGAKITSVTNAGVIPDQFDSDVLLMPDGQRIGSLNEDFVFESLAGDIFQLGNQSYRILKIETGKVLVDDAKGLPPSMPFWFGEGRGRSDELSQAVARLNAAVETRLVGGVAAVERWLAVEHGLSASAAGQLAGYLAAAHAALGALPTTQTVIFERFFDEVGDTHLVIHSVFGSRINKAWGLALRKRFCRKFNFELQASALEDSIVLSLGPSHSFPLEEVKSYLKSETARDVLVQAVLDAPMFAARWRWNATTALAIQRFSGGRRVPPQFQRSDSDDLLSVIFPDQVACAENLVGEREIPDHPLVRQTLTDCLTETMDVAGFERLLAALQSGELRMLACDSVTPSPLAHAILSARPYAFLDDGEAEERRTRAVAVKPLGDVRSGFDLARLDEKLIREVVASAQPDAGNADELHDALCIYGFLTEAEILQLGGPAESAGWLAQLCAQRRATKVTGAGIDDGALPPRPPEALYGAAERLHELRAVLPERVCLPGIAAVSTALPAAETALIELLRNRLERVGPVTAGELIAPLGLPVADARIALLALEAEGAVIRGPFTDQDTDCENDSIFSAADRLRWCDRRLLARMHRLARERSRAQVQPVAPAQFMRFLFAWHRIGLAPESRPDGDEGLQLALRRLEGFVAPAIAWEADLLPVRLKAFSPQQLDRLCASGQWVWCRPPISSAVAVASAADPRPTDAGETQEIAESSVASSRAAGRGPVRATPVLLCERDVRAHWCTADPESTDKPAPPRSSRADRVFDVLNSQGASFFPDLVHDSGMLRADVEQGLGELVGQGLVSCDSFAGLRALILPAARRQRLRRLGRVAADIDSAGRWSLTRRSRPVPPVSSPGGSAAGLADPAVEHIARALLQRYGVVFKALLVREERLPPWRDLHYVYRRLEARGEICGGRFVNGFVGEQFALPDAATQLRKCVEPPEPERITLSAADPLNLAGIITPGERLPKLSGNRIMFENGLPVAVQAGGEVRYLVELEPAEEWALKTALIRRRRPGLEMEPSTRLQ